MNVNLLSINNMHSFIFIYMLYTLITSNSNTNKLHNVRKVMSTQNRGNTMVLAIFGIYWCPSEEEH